MITYNRFFFRTLLIALMLCAVSVHANFTSRAQAHLYADNAQPAPELLHLLSLLHVEHDGSWESIIAATQKNWLRKPGTERWHLEELAAINRDAILQALDDLGCLQSIEPLQTEYDYGIVLGATVFRVRTRLAYLLDQWQKGVRFKTLIFLGSERPLDAHVEPAELLFNPAEKGYAYAKPAWHLTSELPATEYDMIRMVIDQTQFPAGFEQVAIIVINTPMIHEKDGSVRRPGRLDTVKAWLATCPQAGTCLCVSNQPYASYEDSALRTGMPQNFNIETIGEAANPQELIAVHLDNIARWLYQEGINRTSNK